MCKLSSFSFPPSVGVSGQVQGFGSLEFWLRLQVPMQQSIRLHRERLSGLGYVSKPLTEDRHVGSRSLCLAIVTPQR